MWSLGALLLLLVASLAVNASPVPTPPDNIQAQENFNLLRVRLASLVVVAGCLSSWALLGLSPAHLGSQCPLWNSRTGSVRTFLAVWDSLELQLPACAILWAFA